MVHRTSESTSTIVGHPAGEIARPKILERKLLALINCEWRTAREIYALHGKGAYTSTVNALLRLWKAGKICRMFERFGNDGIRTRYKLRS
jgi:hypothetical protein